MQIKDELRVKYSWNINYKRGALMKHRSLYFAFVIAIFLITSGCTIKTPLIKATASGDSLAVQKLINEGANINEPDSRGYTPLMHAIWSKKTETVKVLIDKGADINAKDKKNGYTPLLWAAIFGYSDIAELLIDKGADTHAIGNDGNTPFSVAVRYNITDIVKLLIDKGVDISKENVEGLPALDYAILNKYIDIAALIRGKTSRQEKIPCLSTYEESGKFWYYRPAKNMFDVPADKEQAYKLAVYDCNRMVAYNTGVEVTQRDLKLAADIPKNFQKCMEKMGFGCKNNCIKSTGVGIQRMFTQSKAVDSSIVKSRSNKKSFFSWETYSFHSIDDKLVFSIRSQYNAGLKVEPGQRSFITEVRFKRGFFNGGPFVAFVHLGAWLQPGATYQLMGEVSGDEVFVWLEDEMTREYASERVSAPYMIEPPPDDAIYYSLLAILGIVYLLR